MSTLQFPTLSDRQNVHNLIHLQAHNKCSRDDMMKWITNIVEKYRINRMPIFNYSVQIIRSKYYSQPIINIIGAQMSDDCPTCEKSPDEFGRILRVDKVNHDLDYDIVNVTCLNCGCVYATKGANHRVNTKKEMR